MRFTLKELKVMQRLLVGKTDKEIARDLDCSVSVVRQVVHCLCGKLDATNRTAAAVNYVRINGFTDDFET